MPLVTFIYPLRWASKKRLKVASSWLIGLKLASLLNFEYFKGLHRVLDHKRIRMRLIAKEHSMALKVSELMNDDQ